MSDDIKKPLGTNIPMPKELMGKQFYTQEEMVMKSAKLDKLFLVFHWRVRFRKTEFLWYLPL